MPTAVLTLGLLLAGCSGREEQTETTAASQVKADLTVQADTVQGSANIPEDQRATAVCVLNSRYPRNGEVVFRTRVTDPVTGEELDDQALSSVQVKLGDGTVLDMKYGGHPHDNPVDFFWAAGWDIPADYPTGTLNYEIVATDQSGRTGTFSPFNVQSSLLTITDQVLEPIEQSG
ncbi:MAG: hypothetical protein WB239_13080 [Acidimicrobiia bacterium]